MKIPSVQKLLRSYQKTHGISTAMTAEECFIGNCNSVAIECAKLIGPPARQVRGHWIGESGLQQHSWVECWKFWIDPTRFQFEDVKAYIWVGEKGDENYDLGSHKLREAVRMMIGSTSFPLRDEKGAFKSNLSKPARDAVNAAFDLKRDWTKWSTPELFRIGNTNPVMFGDYAKEIFKAISANNKAIIPIDTFQYLFE